MTLTPNAHADITWHNPTFAHRASEAIDSLLDRRLKLANTNT